MTDHPFADVTVFTSVTAKTSAELKVLAARHGITLKETMRQALTYAAHAKSFEEALSKLYARRDRSGQSSSR